MRDLNNKVDFHCKRLAAKLGRDYDEIWKLHHVDGDPEIGEQRTGAKEFSFQRAYGAGVDAVVTSTGMSKAEVEALVDAEARLYPRVAEFDRQLEATINANRIPTANKLYIEGVAFTQGESHWDSPTGTRYVWREGITPEFLHAKGKYTGFSPTERKNYPVQGFGGEVVQTMLGIVFRYFLENDRFDGNVLLVNTVHDCVILDGVEDYIEEVAVNVQKILESVPDVFNKAYPELNIEVPFPCETEIGRDLFKMEAVH
jgi:DNA polymerase I-like protein with 3'-5' exonuclease and polymerase domains